MQEGQLRLEAEEGRYTLYVVSACPYAARAWMAVKFYGLEALVRVVRSFPGSGPNGWFFQPQSDWEEQAVKNYPEAMSDQEPHYGSKRLCELYKAIEPGYSGPFSLPLLYDHKCSCFASNDSLSIAKALCSPHLKAFRSKNTQIELLPSPADVTETEVHDQLLSELNSTVTAGPYEVIFGDATQEKHEKGSKLFFDALDKYEKLLRMQSVDMPPAYLMGQPRLADIFLFNTAVRWDVGYRWRFNIGGDSIQGGRFPCISALVMELQAWDGVSGRDGAVHMDDIITAFYISTKLADAVAARPFCSPLPPRSGWQRLDSEIGNDQSGQSRTLSRKTTRESLSSSVSEAEMREPRLKGLRTSSGDAVFLA